MTRGYFLEQPRNPGVMKAIIEAGNQRALAAALGVGQSTIHKWLYITVPAERAVQIEETTGVPREEIRPDLFARIQKPTKTKAKGKSHAK